MKNDLWRHCFTAGKLMIARAKYRQITRALCEYVSELVTCQAADGENEEWYNKRLAACARMFSLLLTRDAIRFFTNLDQEVETIARSQIKGNVPDMAIYRWEEFKKIAVIWREQKFSSKQRGSK
jgi:hypothetical protein